MTTNRSEVPELAGPAECAEILEVGHARFAMLAKHPDFPKPIAVLRCATIYLADEIRAFHATRNRQRGRPRGPKK